MIKNVRRGNTIIQYPVENGGIKRDIARKGLVKFFDLAIEYIEPQTRYLDQQLRTTDRSIKNYILAGPLKAMLQGHQVEIVKTLKANGENAQVSYHQPMKAWIISSKNRSIFVRTRADIQKQSKDTAEFAMKMAEVWFTYLESLLQAENGQAWVDQLKQDLSGRTLVGEYVGA